MKKCFLPHVAQAEAGVKAPEALIQVFGLNNSEFGNNKKMQAHGIGLDTGLRRYDVPIVECVRKTFASGAWSRTASKIFTQKINRT